MKVSIITITRHDGPLLRRALDSIYRQRLPDGVELEHIIVTGSDGPDNEPTLAYAAEKGSKILYREPKGCYNAINEGIAAATGDIIGLVHGSDFLADSDRLSKIAEAFADGKLDFVYGDVDFVRYGRESRVVRRYSSAHFTVAKLRAAFSPPHPSLYIRREAALAVGSYREDYRNAADFEYFVRLFLKHSQLKSRYLPMTVACMENDGASSKLYSRIVTNTVEKRRALRDNGYHISWFRLMLRYFLHFK